MGLKNIEDITPNDFVFAHDGKPHKVTRVLKRRYSGMMVGIRHAKSDKTLWVTCDHLVLASRRVKELSDKGEWSSVPRKNFEKARELRKNMTPPERILWKHLSSERLGVKFRRQHTIGPYIPDFYTRDEGLVVEVDGAQHFETNEAVEYDRQRDEYLQSLGLRVLSFTASEISRNLTGVLDTIFEAAREQVLPDDHTKQWRYAANLSVGDLLFFGRDLKPCEIMEIKEQDSIEDVYDLEVEGAHSFLTEVCAIHNCGSGTTAYAAEQWGRRWITCDTSRVAITLAKQRLMTAIFDYYELAHPEEGVGSGFIYKTVPHITLKSIANDEPARQEMLYDQPYTDNKRTRVTGPFTVEAVPAPVVKPLTPMSFPNASIGNLEVEEDSRLKSAGMTGWNVGVDMSIARSGETIRQREWRDELLRCAIRGKNGQYILFSRVEPLSGTRWLHAEGETKPNEKGATTVGEPMPEYKKPQRVVISFGPEHGPLEQRQVELAWEEARSLIPRPSLLVFAAFQFDPEAAKDIDEIDPKKAGMTLLKVQMNADLLTDDLKKKRTSSESFWLIGQPDVKLSRVTLSGAKSLKARGKSDSSPREKRGTQNDSPLYQVEVLGFDYYNTRTGTIDSGGNEKIAMWLLDTDYDGRSLFPRQVFFPMAGENEGWARLARNLKAEINEDLIEAYRGTVSLPFEPGKYKRIAVKIVDDRGIESLKMMEV